jgi:hypothetical protein
MLQIDMDWEKISKFKVEKVLLIIKFSFIEISFWGSKNC